MYKTIEDEVLKRTAPAELWDEFIQHEFERLHSFCLLIYLASMGIWLAFDLIVSFLGDQGFTWRSMIFIAAFAVLAVVLMFTRKARHFDWLNLTFVFVITLGIRLVIDGLPPTFHGIWLVLAAATTLYSASVLPLSRWSFFGAQVITWLILNPFMGTGIGLLELKGVMTICYSVFLCALTIYTFLKLRETKLYNYIMSKLLLDQAYNDTLTEIPNRRSFMTRAEKSLQSVPREQDHYLAMIDIDNFKKVNDVHGHDIGDEVLKRIAADIKAVMAPFEYARLGGEEFAIYLAGVRRDDVEALAGELCRVVREQTTRYPVTISIGVARVEDGDTLNQALIKADEALYESKHTGKDRYTFHQ
jgi:diguanylate cyclase (GGDEF)-like protein